MQLPANWKKPYLQHCVDRWYSLHFIVGLLSLFFLVALATLGSRMSLFRPNGQLLLLWWSWLISSTGNLILTSGVASSSWGIISFSILVGIMSPNILLWFCCKSSSGTSNNWSLVLTSPFWSILYHADDWIYVVDHHMTVVLRSTLHFFQW